LDSTAHLFLEKLRTFSCKKRLSPDRAPFSLYSPLPLSNNFFYFAAPALKASGHAKGVRIMRPCIESEDLFKNNESPLLEKNTHFLEKLRIFTC